MRCNKKILKRISYEVCSFSVRTMKSIFLLCTQFYKITENKATKNGKSLVHFKVLYLLLYYYKYYGF